MSNLLRSPSLGPLVGHTTATTVRLWMRGAEVGDSRTMGVAAIFDGAALVHVCYLRLKREYDRTGWVDFDDLAPDTDYVVRMGSLSVDTIDPDQVDNDADILDKLVDPTRWVAELLALPVDEAEAQVRTAPAGAQTSLAFVFGSCRYPGFLGTTKRADRIFGAIGQRFVVSADRPRFLLMVGDQIYADTLSRYVPIGKADTAEEFRDRYTETFGAPNMRALLRTTPTYMTLDDHEIEDNWVQTRVKDAAKRELFNVAISFYRSYQWLHGPKNYGDSLYYDFQVGGFPFFVTDGRTQRLRDDDDQVLADNHLLGRPTRPATPEYKGQIDLLCDWLVAQQAALGDRPKFVVSASVFVPNTMDARSFAKRCDDDSWAAFPVTRRQLLQTILDHGVQNVVFLSGDIHVSCVAELSFDAADGSHLPIRAFSIVSSAFYWPFPFADGNPLDYVHDSRAREEFDAFAIDDPRADSRDASPARAFAGRTMHYRAHDFEQDDNFAEIVVDWTGHSILVHNFDNKGRKLCSSTLALA